MSKTLQQSKGLLLQVNDEGEILEVLEDPSYFMAKHGGSGELHTRVCPN